jgi:hypothetical protein
MANGMWNKFYCWLLYFSFYHEIRNNQGFLGLHHLSSAQQKHSKPQTHVHCYLQLKLFGKQQTVDPVTVESQTPLMVWQLHMNGNKEWPGLPEDFIILCWPKQVGVVCNNGKIYETCPESIQPFWISREPITWPWCNLAGSQRRPYNASMNRHSPMGLVSRHWDAVDWDCVPCDHRGHKSPHFQQQF